MKVGWMGLGKLGLPCALACESKGYEVVGYDVSAEVLDNIRARRITYQEAGAQELLDRSRIRLVGVERLVDCDIIFVAVQTPHDPRFEGAAPLPDERADFDYSSLRGAVAELDAEAAKQGKRPIVAVVSTVLPGTMRREILPLAGHLRIAYNPFFIAMGTCIQDFLFPEFVLLGIDDEKAATAVEKFYATITEAPVYRTSVVNAEAIKVFYNTWISTRIGTVSAIMEFCHRIPGCDAGAVLSALKLADRRLISTAYMDPGMPDGGGCHPRDNIALSHCARRHNLSVDWFGFIMEARDRQADWLAGLIEERHSQTKLPVVVLGKAFKPGTNITTGSPALLLSEFLWRRGVQHAQYDPVVDPDAAPFDKQFAGPRIFFVATRHDCFRSLPFPLGSCVVDPWHFAEVPAGVEYVPVGIGPKA